MEKLLIKGGNTLNGEISCSGAKNAALPMIAATILNNEKVIFKNLPYLQDITTMFELLGSMGADISLDESMDFSIMPAHNTPSVRMAPCPSPCLPSVFLYLSPPIVEINKTSSGTIRGSSSISSRTCCLDQALVQELMISQNS